MISELSEPQIISNGNLYHLNEYQQVHDEALRIGKKYHHLIITDENASEMRRVRTHLNRIIRKLNRVRIDIKNKNQAPIQRIDRDIQAIIEPIKTDSDEMGKTFKKFREQKKLQLKRDVLDDKEHLCTAYGIDPNRVEDQPQWFALSLSKTKRRAMIKTSILVAKQNLKIQNMMAERIKVEAKALNRDAKPYLHLLNSMDNDDKIIEIMRQDDVADKAKQAEAKQHEAERQANAKKFGRKTIDENGEVIDEELEQPIYEHLILRTKNDVDKFNKMIDEFDFNGNIVSRED